VGERVDLGINLFNYSFWINEVTYSVGSEIFSANESFLNESVIGFHHGFVGIGKQSKGETVAICEVAVAPGTVFADTHNFDVAILKNLILVTKRAGFGGAARSIIARIEVKEEVFAFIVGESFELTVLIFSGEVGGWSAYF